MLAAGIMPNQKFIMSFFCHYDVLIMMSQIFIMMSIFKIWTKVRSEKLRNIITQ